MPSEQYKLYNGGDRDVLSNGAVLPHNGNVPASGSSSSSVPPSTWGEFDLDPTEWQAEQRFGRGAAGVVGNALNSLWNFIKVPGDVRSGEYSLDEISRMAPGYALGLAGLGTPIGAAAIPENSLGIFGGSRSLTAGKGLLALADRLESAGADPDRINALTRWFRGPDNLWRYTIPDEAAELNPAGFKSNRYAPDAITLGIDAYKPGGIPFSNVLTHPKLFEAYPEIADYSVVPESNPLSYRASFSPLLKQFTLSGNKPATVLSSVLHEVQHAVQGIEDFARGGSPSEFLPPAFAQRVKENSANKAQFMDSVKSTHPELSDADLYKLNGVLEGHYPADNSLIRKLDVLLRWKLAQVVFESSSLSRARAFANDRYRRLAGEVESRAVQEQLAHHDWRTPIWQHTGYVPFEQQIILPPFNIPQAESSVSSELSLTPVEHDPFATR